MHLRDNIRWISPYLTDLQKTALSELTVSPFVVEEVDGDWRLFKDGVALTKEGENTHTDSRVKQYLVEPYRLYFSDSACDHYANNEVPEIGDFAFDFNKNICRRYKGKLTNSVQMDGVETTMVCFGLHLGFQLERLYESPDLKDIIICDSNLDCLYYSLQICDWSTIIQLVEARGGRIFFIFSDDAELMATSAIEILQKTNFLFLEGTFVYIHNEDPILQNALLELQKRFPNLLAYNGWLEDENQHLENAVKNIANKQDPVLLNKFENNEFPAIVIGSGPSLDENLSWIKSNKDNFVIISAGTALKPVLDCGIVPDFHCELENGPHVAWVLSELASKYDLKNITLLSSVSVDPHVRELFNSAYFFLREGDGTMKWLAGEYSQMELSAPSCTNSAVRCAIQMGFKHIYLFGMDFGTAIKESHHSASSIYNNAETIKNKDIQRLANAVEHTFDLETKGNFKEVIYTKPLHNMMRLHLENLAAHFSNISILNCSDGAYIRGCQPQHTDDLTPSIRYDKGDILSSIRKFFSDGHHLQDLLSFDRLKLLPQQYSLSFKKLVSATHQPVESIFDLIININNIYLQSGSSEYSSMSLKDTLSGSLLKILHLLRFFELRMGNDKGSVGEIQKFLALELEKITAEQLSFIEYLKFLYEKDNIASVPYLNDYHITITMKRFALEGSYSDMDEMSETLINAGNFRSSLSHKIGDIYMEHQRLDRYLEILQRNYTEDSSNHTLGAAIVHYAAIGNQWGLLELVRFTEDDKATAMQQAMIGLTQIWSGDFERAAPFIHASYDMHSRNHVIFCALGALNIGLKRYQTGMECFEKALAFDSNNLLTVIEKAYGLLAQEKFVELIAFCKEYLEIHRFNSELLYLLNYVSNEDVYMPENINIYGFTRMRNRVKIYEAQRLLKI